MCPFKQSKNYGTTDLKQTFCVFLLRTHPMGETRTTLHTQYNIELYKESVTKTGTAVLLPSFHSDVFHLEEQEVPFLYRLQPNSAKKKVTMRIKKKPKHTSKVRNYRSQLIL